MPFLGTQTRQRLQRRKGLPCSQMPLIALRGAHAPLACAVAIACTTRAVLLRESRVVFTFAGLDVDTKYLLLCAAISCWGVAKGGGNVVDSSLADSVPTGARC